MDRSQRSWPFVPCIVPTPFHPILSPDWANDIRRRAVYDPDPQTGRDRSLRAYIHTVSSGRADLDAVVLPMEMIDQQNVPVDALDDRLGSRLRDQGFDAAAIVMPWAAPARARRCNAAASGPFVMLEGGRVGHGIPHCLTAFDDLYPFGGNMGTYDEMACSCGNAPVGLHQNAIGWLDDAAIFRHAGRVINHDLHPVSLIQPPASGQVAAVRIGNEVPYLMVEARRRVDPFDARITAEGVIVYRVQTTHPLGSAQKRHATGRAADAHGVGRGPKLRHRHQRGRQRHRRRSAAFLTVVDDRNAPYERPAAVLHRDFTRDGTGDVPHRVSSASAAGGNSSIYSAAATASSMPWMTPGGCCSTATASATAPATCPAPASSARAAGSSLAISSPAATASSMPSIPLQ